MPLLCFSKSGFGLFLVHERTSVNCPLVDLVQCPCVDVGEVHVRGPWKFVLQMSIFGDVHAWTFPKSTRGHRFPAGYRPMQDPVLMSQSIRSHTASWVIIHPHVGIVFSCRNNNTVMQRRYNMIKMTSLVFFALAHPWSVDLATVQGFSAGCGRDVQVASAEASTK